MNSKLLLGVISLFGCLSMAAAPPPRWAVDLNQGKGAVEFSAIGTPAAIKIHGKGDAPKGKLSIGSGKITGSLTFSLASLDTGIKMRNEHMKNRYLEVSKFPLATLDFISIKLPADFSKNFSQSSIPFEGKLTLHGVSKMVKGAADVKKDGPQVNTEARFTILVADFGIQIPSFAEVTMTNKVDVAVNWSAPITSVK